VVVDQAVDPLIADPCAFLGAGAVPIAGNGVAGPREAGEAFRVDMQQVSGAGPLVAAWRVSLRRRRT